ncbi:hypothetical protein T265_04462 [Opisthorchis viverrini]|uniref:Uncharacterized protein n=1 Tax=Opisthorchis viverrini TaxID=6198 RepID=A0A074ZNU1_OPIVI|nr:hypothetical protein T265_04462 [Opisthorchis viverrini]KER28771.1 hypothetical protein T265_04462 [Opisthorchis viverrini]
MARSCVTHTETPSTETDVVLRASFRMTQPARWTAHVLAERRERDHEEFRCYISNKFSNCFSLVAEWLSVHTTIRKVIIISIVSCNNRVLVVRWLKLPQFRSPMIWGWGR